MRRLSSLLFAIVITTCLAPSGFAGQNKCIDECTRVWSKKFHECKEVKECEAFCLSEGRLCIQKCDSHDSSR